MSSIGSVGAFSGSSWAPRIQGTGMPKPSAEMRQPFEAKFESAAEAAGIDPSVLAEIRTQMESAVQSALEQGLSGSELKDSVDSAVNKVLEDNGIDPETFKAQMAEVFEQMGVPQPGQGGYGRPGGGFSSSGQEQQQQLLSKLLEQLGSSSSASWMQQFPVGSFFDAAA